MTTRVRRGIIGVFVLLGLAVIIGLAWLFFSRYNVQVLNAQGTIAESQRSLLLWATGLMLLVVIPVFIMAFWFAWHYRESNKKARYMPEWDHNVRLETAWWLIPFVIIGVLAVMAWQSSHELDPAKPIVSTIQPLTIEVVAMQWKWLFIYPDQHVASVNEVAFPAGIPVNFIITSDAPMNSFWIPQLAGQIYAMPGMATQLHIMADHPGDYAGSSANISGAGFAGMKFTAKAMSSDNFALWLSHVRASHQALSESTYYTLAQPSQNNPPTYYTLVDNNLYSNIVMKYMAY